MACRRTATLFAIVAAAAAASCGGDRLPVAPSSFGSAAPLPEAHRSLGPSDYHEQPMPAPTPGPTPTAPTTVTISIVGSAGPEAFAPNPLQASVGQHTVVWTNNDVTVHRIVLDDGTTVGTISPGQSTSPIAVSAASVTYRCTIHPSMVGTIQDPAVVSPTPGPTPAPTPPPDYSPPDDDDDYGYYSLPVR